MDVASIRDHFNSGLVFDDSFEFLINNSLLSNQIALSVYGSGYNTIKRWSLVNLSGI